MALLPTWEACGGPETTWTSACLVQVMVFPRTPTIHFRTPDDRDVERRPFVVGHRARRTSWRRPVPRVGPDLRGSWVPAAKMVRWSKCVQNELRRCRILAASWQILSPFCVVSHLRMPLRPHQNQHLSSEGVKGDRASKGRCVCGMGM